MEMDKCEYSKECGFFLKYNSYRADRCQKIFREYCMGEKSDFCKRKLYRVEHSVAPPDDMTPSGRLFYIL